MSKTGEIELEEPFPSYTAEELLAIVVEHTQQYNNDDEPLPTKFTKETSHITPDGNVRVNPITAWEHGQKLGLNEEDTLRLLLDVLSHEVEHYNESDLSSKKKMTENFPQAPKLAGTVINIVEDCYIDNNRLKRFEGLRIPFDRSTEANISRYKNLDESRPVESCVKILTIGFRLGEMPVEPEKEFLQRFSEIVMEKYRETLDAHTQQERIEIAEELTATIIDNLSVKKPPELDILEELIKELAEKVEDVEVTAKLMTEEEMAEKQDEAEEKAIQIDVDIEEPESGDTDDDSSSDGESDSRGDEDGGSSSGSSSSGSDSSSTGSSSDGSKPETGGESPDSDGSSESDDGENNSEPSKTVEEARVSGDAEEPPEDSKDVDVETAVFDGDKFREIELGGGTEDDEHVTVGVLSKEAYAKTRKTSVQLSEDVEKILEKLDDKQNRPKQVNAAKGKNLDIKKSVRYMSGDKTSRKIYTRKLENEPDNRAIGLTIDGSGSMKGAPIKNALETAGALGKAAQKVGDDFTANIFYSYTDDETSVKTGQKTDVDWLTRLNEEFTMSDLEDAETYYREPIALGLRETRSELQKSGKSGDKIIFVLHDGNPTITADGFPYYEKGIEDDAVEEAEEEVTKTRNLGFKVIGIAVGDQPQEDILNQMFGDDGWFRFEPDDLAENILKIYRNQ